MVFTALDVCVTFPLPSNTKFLFSFCNASSVRRRKSRSFPGVCHVKNIQLHATLHEITVFVYHVSPSFESWTRSRQNPMGRSSELVLLVSRLNFGLVMETFYVRNVRRLMEFTILYKKRKCKKFKFTYK